MSSDSCSFELKIINVLKKCIGFNLRYILRYNHIKDYYWIIKKIK
jgi:hypothetical protein